MLSPVIWILLLVLIIVIIFIYIYNNNREDYVNKEIKIKKRKINIEKSIPKAPLDLKENDILVDETLNYIDGLHYGISEDGINDTPKPKEAYILYSNFKERANTKYAKAIIEDRIQQLLDKNRNLKEMIDNGDELELDYEDMQIDRILTILNTKKEREERNIERNVENTVLNDPLVVAVTSDKQNVHDHTLQKTIKSAIDKMEINNSETFRDGYEVIKYLEDNLNCHNLTPQKERNIRMVLDRLRICDLPLSQYDKSPLEILCLVGCKIMEKKDKDNYLEMLYEELNQCVENNMVVCTSGIAAHIVDTLNVLDPDVKLISKWQLNRIMMNKAKKITDDLYEKNEDITEEELKQELIKVFTAEYKDICNPNMIKAEIENWIL